MYISLVVLSLFVFLENFFVDCNDYDLAMIDSVYPEQPCSREGGMCVIASDCPTGHLSREKGLCPAQQSRNIECCHGSSLKETRCRKLGGECKSEFCKLRPIYQRSADCPETTRCCILE